MRQALSLFGDSAKCNFPGDELMEVEGVGSDGSAVKVRMMMMIFFALIL